MTNMTIETFNPEQAIKDLSPITLTEAALDYVRQQIKKQGKGIGLRIRVKTAGCSGKMYKPEIAEQQETDEVIFQVTSDVAVLVTSTKSLR